MRKCFGTLILLAVCIMSHAQVRVKGEVLNTQNKPIVDVIVKVVSEGQTLAFTTTMTDGSFSLEINDSKQINVSLVFSHIGYETESKTLSLPTKGNIEINMLLRSKNLFLPEVKIRTLPLRLSGDTLSFNLSSFLGKNDVTLEDGIRRLPGIDVKENGQISYMGKPIAQFNIEDLNLLGGKYSLATRNMKAEYAKTVQVIRNYHSRKVDEGKPSNNTAINIKLADKAKFKPFGSEEAGMGYMQDGRDNLQVLLGLTGMLFTDKYQALGTVKTGNYKNYAISDLSDHFGKSDISSRATSLFGRFESGQPPHGDYEHQRNAIIALNGIQKVDTFTTIKVNTDYTYHNTLNEVNQSTTYFNGNDYVVVTEKTTPFTTFHKPHVTLGYEINRKDFYLENTFVINALFDRNNGDIQFSPNITSGLSHDVEQRRRSATIGIKNHFIFFRKTEGKGLGEVVSDISFNTTPKLNLFFSNAGETYGQTAQSTSFVTNTSTTFGHSIGSSVELSVTLGAHTSYDYITTNRTMTNENNQIKGWEIMPTIALRGYFKSKGNRINSNFGIPLELRKLRYCNQNYAKLSFNPWLTMEYVHNMSNKFSISSSYGTILGDMMSLLTDSMQTNYRSAYVASGVIGESSTWQSTVSWDFSIPFQYLSLHAELSHNDTKKNTLSSQNINGINASNSFLLIDNKEKNTDVKLSAYKNIPVLLSKFTVNAACGFGNAIRAVKTEQIKVKNNHQNLGGKIDITPLEWIELNYDISYRKNRIRYDGYNSTIESVVQSGTIHLFPITSVDLSMDYNNAKQQISEDTYKHMSIFNASVQYKLKKCVFKIEISNLLNQRSYSYMVFDGINAYSYDYGLCGRTAILKATFNM